MLNDTTGLRLNRIKSMAKLSVSIANLFLLLIRSYEHAVSVPHRVHWHGRI